MNENQETKLIQSAKKGNKVAFEQLIELYEKKVYNIALHMLKNEEDAKDAAQDSLIKIYRNIKKFDGKSSFSTWVYRVTVNTSLDLIRKKKSSKERDTYSLDDQIQVNEQNTMAMGHQGTIHPESHVMKQERLAYLKNALELLNEEQRMMIVLRDIQGFSYKEIADITKTTEGTVKSRLNRSRKKLKEILMDTELFRRESV